MEQYNEAVEAVIHEVKKAVSGKDACIYKIFAAILAGGHILIEDVPGVGKTTLAVAFSKAMGLLNHRVQFTPDVMPSDLLGFYMYQKETDQFVFHPGTIMCNLFLADEINRTSPKTQSALLEVMEESKVTVDGVSHEVPKPFIVMATQNPKGSAGTQLLPESQLDRFMICMSMGYPDAKSEIEIAKGKSVSIQGEVTPVLDPQALADLQCCVENVHIDESIYEYIVELMTATRNNNYIELGVSPRGTIACVRMAKAWAFLQGRSFVVSGDVSAVFMDTAKHRIVLGTKARAARMTAESVLKEIQKSVHQPASFMKKMK